MGFYPNKVNFVCYNVIVNHFGLFSSMWQPLALSSSEASVKFLNAVKWISDACSAL
jgi:hypothetical protein